MDDFDVIYRILTVLRDAMRYEQPDLALMMPDALNVEPAAWRNYLEMLADSGYVKGIRLVKMCGGTQAALTDPKITLKGLEYLESNPLMRRALRAAKGIKDAAPGL